MIIEALVHLLRLVLSVHCCDVTADPRYRRSTRNLALKIAIPNLALGICDVLLVLSCLPCLWSCGRASASVGRRMSYSRIPLALTWANEQCERLPGSRNRLCPM
jgi:hypothetical protein